ncbi:hypothetical protein BDN67DRAFT_1016545 [Paxillus ammoniavirescens]|nr:hypothetical protein BDN67DRAFT_1016545 [Paxillus ammoniavirescens]
MDENNAQSVENIETNSSTHPSEHFDDMPPNKAEATLSGPVPGPAGLDDNTDSSHWWSPDADDCLAVSNLLCGGFQEGNNYQDDLPPSSPPAPSPPPYLTEDEALDTEEPPPMGESNASGSNYSSDVQQREKQEKQEAAKAAALPNIPRATLANLAPSQALISKVSTSKAVAKCVSGRKARKVPLKMTALLSNLEMDEEEDVSGDDDNNEDGDDDEGHEGGKAQRKGPLTVEALAECDALVEKIEAMVRELADKHQKSPCYILKHASLALSFSRKYNFWNIHQVWFYGMQAEEGEDPAVLKQRQHEHYQQIKATPKEDVLWTEIIEYAKAKEMYSGPKTPAGRLMQVHNMFTQMAQVVSRMELIHIFGFAIYTGVEEGGHQAAGIWTGSKVIRLSIKKYGVDLKKMIDWWTTTLKYESANIQASALFCSGEEADRDHNWHALRYMFLDLLVQQGYSGTSVLWRKLLKLVDKLRFTIINWPDEVPVPDQHFNFHHLPLSALCSLLESFLWQHLGDRYEAELKEIAENLKRSKGKGKGKAKHCNHEDNEDNEEVVQPDPNDDIRFVGWSVATMEKIERSKDGRKQTPLLVSRNLEDLFYVRDLEPVGDDSCPNILEGPEANEGKDEDKHDRCHPHSPSPREHSPTP